MRGWRRQGLAWLSLAIHLFPIFLLPVPAFAQSVKAGIVTTLEGSVTAVRTVTPQPVPLKFKDDVFLRDRVVTAERSFARLLLGGKAVVSIRERSSVTITEAPGRSTIDIESGKIALSVAHDRMRPGEVINIKTPNAIAGVRGTVVVAEVTYRLGRRGSQQPLSNLWVLRGVVDAVHTNAAGVPLGPPFPLKAQESLTADATTSTKGTFTLEQVSTIVQGLQPARTADPGSASQTPARLEAVNTATALLAALVGPSAQTALATGAPPPIPTPETQPEIGVTSTQITPLTEAPPLQEALPPLPPLPPSPPTPPPSPPVVTTGYTLGGVVDSTQTSPFIELNSTTVEQSSGDNFVTVLPGAHVTFAGPLLSAVDSTLDIGNDLLNVAGAFATSSTASFIALDPTTVVAPGNLVGIGAGGALVLAGPLLADVGGTMDVGHHFIGVSDGGTLSGASTQALVQLTGSAASIGSGGFSDSAFLSVRGSESTVSLAGPLLSAAGGTLAVSGLALVDVSNGGSVSSTSTAPFVDLAGTALGLPPTTFVVSRGSLSVGGSLLHAQDLATAPDLALLVDHGGSVAVGGPVFDVANTPAGVRIFLGDTSSLASNGGPLVRATGGLLVTDSLVAADDTGNVLALHGPALEASNALVALERLFDLGDSDVRSLELPEGAPVVRLASSVMVVTSETEPLVTFGAAAGTPVTQTGVALIATGTPEAPSALVLGAPLLSLRAVSLADVSAQVQLANAALLYTGEGSLIDVAGPATLAGGLVEGVDASAIAGGSLLTVNGGSLTVAGSGAPLITLTGTTPGASLVNTGRQLVRLMGSPASTMTLSGPLLEATRTSIVTGNPTTNAFGLLFVVDGATLTGNGHAPLVSLDHSFADLAGTMLSVRRSPSPGAPTTVTLAGPLLLASNSAITTTTSGFDALFGTTGQPCCPLVSIHQGARLTTTQDVPLLQLTSSTVNAGPDARSGSSLFVVGDTFTGAPAGELTAPSTAALAGTLLEATNSTISALIHLVQVTNSTLSSDTVNPLVHLSGGSLTLGGPNPLQGNAATIGRLLSLSGAGASLALHGPLFGLAGTTVTSTGEILGVFNGASLTSTTGQALVDLGGASFTTGHVSNFMTIAGASPTVQLAGPLLHAANAVLRNGDPTTNAPGNATLRAFTFIGDSAQVVSTSTQPLFEVSGTTTLDTSGSLISVRRSLSTATPTRLTLAGPLFRATDDSTIDVTSLALGSACCAAFDVEQAAQLVSSTTTPLIQLSNSVLNAGPDAQSGGTLFFVSDSGLTDGPIVASPALVSLHGPLISSTNSTMSSLFHLVGVQRSTLTSTATGALIQLTGSRGVDPALRLGGVDPFVQSGNTTRSGRVLSVVASLNPNTSGDAALVSLAGPLLEAVAAPIELTGDVVGIFNGATVTSTSTLPFVRLNATPLTAGATDPTSGTVVDGRLALISGVGGPDFTPASLRLSGPFLRAEVGSVVDTNSRGLSLFTDGALVTRAPIGDVPPYPLLAVDASTLRVGGDARPGRLFEITGSGALANDLDLDPVTGAASPLQFGQQRPLQHNGGGPLLQASSAATVEVRGANGNVLRLDTALLEATAPLIALTGSGTFLQTSGTAIDLANHAKVDSSGEALVKLENLARLDVLSGHLANVSASRLNVTGDFLRMASGTQLNILNGVLLSLLNGGIAKIGGSLVNFTGSNATINVTNNLVPTTFLSGIPVFVAPGASSHFSIGANALAGLNSNNNVIKINGTNLATNATSGVSGSLISIGGSGGTVKIGP
jgi:hypothetical protein